MIVVVIGSVMIIEIVVMIMIRKILICNDSIKIVILYH